MGPHEDRAEGNNLLPLPAGHAAFDVTQDTGGLLDCKNTSVTHSCPIFHRPVSHFFFVGLLSVTVECTLVYILSAGFLVRDSEENFSPHAVSLKEGREMGGNEEARPGLSIAIWVVRCGGIRLHAIV